MYTQQVPPPHLASLHSSVAFCCGLRACEHHVSESCDTSFIYKSHGSHHTWGNLGKEDSYFCISFVFLLKCLYLIFLLILMYDLYVYECVCMSCLCQYIFWYCTCEFAFGICFNRKFLCMKMFSFPFFFLWSAMSLASTGVSRSFICLLLLWTLLLNM